MHKANARLNSLDFPYCPGPVFPQRTVLFSKHLSSAGKSLLGIGHFHSRTCPQIQTRSLLFQDILFSVATSSPACPCRDVRSPTCSTMLFRSRRHITKYLQRSEFSENTATKESPKSFNFFRENASVYKYGYIRVLLSPLSNL